MDSVNFLPPELQSNKKSAKKNKKEQLELNSPTKEQPTKGKLSSFLHRKPKKQTAILKNTPQPKTGGQALNQAHQDVLQELNQIKKAPPVKTSPAPSKEIKPEQKINIPPPPSPAPKKEIPEPAKPVVTENKPPVTDHKIEQVKSTKTSLWQKVINWWKKLSAKKKQAIPKVEPAKLNLNSEIKPQPKNKISLLSKLTKLFKRKPRPAKVTHNEPIKKEAPSGFTSTDKLGHDILETNLIKGQSTAFFSWQRLIYINIASILGTFFVIAVVYFYLGWVTAQTPGSLVLDTKLSQQKEIVNNLQKQVNEIEPLRKKVLAINSLLPKHIYWTNFFNYIEEMTLPGVYYDGFVGDLSGKYTLEAVTEDFDNVVQTMSLWQEDEINGQSTVIKGIEYGTNSGGRSRGNSTASVVNFLINFNVNPNLFYNNFQ